MANAADTVGGWIDSATNWLWANVVAPALDDLRNWAVDALNGLASVFNTLSGWVTDFYNNVLLPVWQWVESAEQWLEDRLASRWDQVWAVTFGPARWPERARPLEQQRGPAGRRAGQEAAPMVCCLMRATYLHLLQFFTDPVGFLETHGRGGGGPVLVGSWA